ncbi:MAG: carboxypeptidase-like regulatory domain-containing protein [Planctomycetes bacterium]|nr:carboxypeptidase-like regulatory domain-containing protein [Planctomycetota bacterium]
MRIITVCALALAVGCGGGGGTTTTAAAQLAGTVYEVDGQRFDLAGVQVTLKETGEWAWTDSAGSFEFGGLEPGTYTLDFGGGIEGAPGGDEFSDGAGDPKVDVPEGGRVEIRVALEDGEVKDYESGCEEDRSAVATLEMTGDAADGGFEVAGAVKVAERDGGTLFKVVVEGLEGGAVIEVFLGEASIGTATADGDGRACLVFEDELPLGAADLSELAGLGVGVTLSESGLALLTGEVPALANDEDDGKDGDEGEWDGDKPDGEEGAEDKDEGEECEEDDDGTDDGEGDGTDGTDGTEGGSEV